MKALLSRVQNILLRPGAEWQIIKEEPTTYEAVLFYIAVLAVVPPAAAVAGRVFFDGSATHSAPVFPLRYVMFTNLLWYVMYIANVAVTGAVIAAIIATADSRWDGLKGLKIAAYSFTPLVAAGFLSVIPYLSWTVPVAILYGVYILYLGIKTLSGLSGMRAIGCAAGSFLSAAVIVGVMNLFEYVLESFLTSRMFL